MEHTSLEDKIKSEARRLGFDLVGICQPQYSATDHSFLLAWLDKGHHGEMLYMARNPRLRSDPRLLMEGVKSIVSVGISYYKEPDYHPDKPYVSIYARGQPYQKVLKGMLRSLFKYIQSVRPEARGKIAVDTTPTFDKLWAEKAGLGWRGKNTLLISESLGSFIFLGELFLDIELQPDDSETDLCADCTKCLDCCPTGALEGPHLLNAVKCISYLTIECSKGTSVDDPMAVYGAGNHLFGCDLCQLACPYNQSLEETDNVNFSPASDFDVADINRLAALDERGFRNRFQGTILPEYGFNRFKRNIEMVKRHLCRC